MDVVTGAFSFTGRYIAARLLDLGREVRTLTRKQQEEDPFGGRVKATRPDFADPARLAEALDGTDTVYNTHWIRFPRADVTFATAVGNTEALFSAAREAGVRRLVQLSVTNASADSPLPYFRAKAAAELALAGSGLSYAVVRPTLVFGRGEILVNNIAWLLRKLPLFVVPGSGRYAVQPVAVEDVAELSVEAGLGDRDAVLDAAGPAAFAFEDLVRQIRDAIGARAMLVHGPPSLALALSRPLGRLAGGTLLTRDELEGLMESLLVSKGNPTGKRRFEDWLTASASSLGARFGSDLSRPWS
ncbi:MAG: NAD(P)H-binding protein [Gaiellaceae bacterium]